MPTYQAVIDFWFHSIEPSAWWKKDERFDRDIAQQFGELHRRASQCELSGWRRQPYGRLAEIIVLDQFSRNIYRDAPQAFASDSLALALSQEAIAAGADQHLQPVERSFLYMPFMHSESLAIHEQAVALFTQNGIQSNLEFELKHKAIIEQFGRYPHRNAILGRPSTAQELRFLDGPNSSF